MTDGLVSSFLERERKCKIGVCDFDLIWENVYLLGGHWGRSFVQKGGDVKEYRMIQARKTDLAFLQKMLTKMIKNLRMQ
jgi:hypothetical protein